MSAGSDELDGRICEGCGKARLFFEYDSQGRLRCFDECL